MAKELPYFRFTVAEWMNGDISMMSKEVKGDFADICAFYWFKDCSIDLAKLKQRFSNATASIKELLKENIIKHNSETDFVEINFLDEQYEALSNLHEARRLAGQKGGYSKAKAKHKQGSGYKDNNKDNDKEKDKYNRGKFSPPTIEDVSKYIQEKGYDVSPMKWFNHYTANGWMVGKNKMKDWKAAIRTWLPDKKKEVHYDFN